MKTSNETRAKAEMMLMGVTQPITKSELVEIIPIIQSAIGTDIPCNEVMEQLFKYTQEGTVPRHAVMNTLMGSMKCLTVTLDDGETPYVIDSEFGVLSTVYNFTCPDCSEMGYTFFSNNNGLIKRIA